MSSISEIFSGPYTFGKVMSIIVIIPWYIMFTTLDTIVYVLSTVFEPIFKGIFMCGFFTTTAMLGWGLLLTVLNAIYNILLTLFGC
jgi:ABC-type multidrug transport system permease subunit